MDARTILLENLRFERRLTRETVAAMADGDMAYRPTNEQMEFGAQVLHNLSAYATLMEGFSGKGWNWNQGMSLAKYPNQEAILKLFDEETARLLNWVEGLAPETLFEPVQTGWGAKEPALQILISWVAHEAHHRGQMVVYLRLKGMEPAKY